VSDWGAFDLILSLSASLVSHGGIVEGMLIVLLRSMKGFFLIRKREGCGFGHVKRSLRADFL
jgi:hypothetical protein